MITEAELANMPIEVRGKINFLVGVYGRIGDDVRIGARNRSSTGYEKIVIVHEDKFGGAGLDVIAWKAAAKYVSESCVELSDISMALTDDSVFAAVKKMVNTESGRRKSLRKAKEVVADEVR